MSTHRGRDGGEEKGVGRRTEKAGEKGGRRFDWRTEHEGEMGWVGT
jgi:hypothetical protein